MTPSAKLSWQSLGADAELPSIDEVRAGSLRFERMIRRRNFIEYVACIVVVVAFGAYVVFLPGLLVKAGSALIVLATLYVAWQLHARASFVRDAAASGLHSVIAHQRAQLARQRDALRTVFRWYLAPFLPGLTMMMAGSAVERTPSPLAVLSGFTLAALVIGAVFGSIWWLNQRAAARLGREIDALDALLRE